MQAEFVKQKASDQQDTLAKLEMVSSGTFGKYLTKFLANHILSAVKSQFDNKL